MTRFAFGKQLVGSVIFLALACGGSQPSPTSPKCPRQRRRTQHPFPRPRRERLRPRKRASRLRRPRSARSTGRNVELYTLTNKNGLVMKVTNYGVIITELWVPDKSGKAGDIVGGYENVDGYVKATPYFGTTVGRVANRIKDATFKLDGKAYKTLRQQRPTHAARWQEGLGQSRSGPRRPARAPTIRPSRSLTFRRTAKKAFPAR